MKLLISCLFIISFSGISFTQNCNGRIIIHSDNRNLKVLINDTLEVTGQNEIYLSKGFYNVNIAGLSNLWNAQTIQESFSLDSCETHEINFNMSNQILIDSEPQDVMVYFCDSLLGFTPLRLASNYEKLSLRKNGFADKEVELDNRISKINVSLDFIGKNKKENFFNTTASKILFGSMIALGATSAYFKIKADKNYDQYLKTGDISFKDQTERYDLISGITLGLSQINFGYLVYKIFFDK